MPGVLSMLPSLRRYLLRLSRVFLISIFDDISFNVYLNVVKLKRLNVFLKKSIIVGTIGC